MSKKKTKRFAVRTAILAVMAAVIIYTLYANFTKDSRGKLSAGDKAPDFVLEDLQGEKHKLSDYQGQGVFLNFWGSWCKPCEKEMPGINSQYKKNKDDGIQVLAINVGDTEFLARKFAEKHGLAFPVVRDKDKDVQNAYGVYNLPATILVRPDGTIELIQEGELSEQKVGEFMESIKPK